MDEVQYKLEISNTALIQCVLAAIVSVYIIFLLPIDFSGLFYSCYH